MWVPDPDARVQRSSGDPDSIKGDGVDLAEVALQRPETSSLGDAPHSSRGVVAARHDNVVFDLQTSHAGLMADEHVLAESSLDVPDAQRRVSRARDGQSVVGHLQASHGRRVTSEGVDALSGGEHFESVAALQARYISPQGHSPSRHVPDSHVPIAATADEGVAPWHHRPDAHDMPGEGLLMLAVGVEDVDLGVVQGDDDVLRREVEAGDDSLVGRDVSTDRPAAAPPRRLDHVSLLEVRLVRHRLRSPLDGEGTGGAVEALRRVGTDTREGGLDAVEAADGLGILYVWLQVREGKRSRVRGHGNGVDEGLDVVG